MSAVSRWLERAGFAEYVDAFERHNIDFELLISLTERDLEKFGLPPEPRQAILCEIERLAHSSFASVDSAAPSRDAERRQLTLMFCDLVNSVGLSTRLDPEDLRDVIKSYQQTCLQPIRRYSGYVARYIGDGILVFFGYPAAHEDDAERAIRAGLEIVHSLYELNQRIRHLGNPELQVRIGIATGLVVVGDVIAEGFADRDAVTGEAPNLAARLQGLASPNTVVVSPTTRKLAAERFEYRDLGTRTVRGFREPVALYQVIAERPVSRLEARSINLIPFVGREKELQILLERWQSAEAGNGQVVILSGEAGIGKSRIAAEARARIRGMEPASDADTSLIFQCSPHHTNAALYPIIRQLEVMARIGSSDADPEKIGKLQSLLQGYDEQTITLFADLLGINPGTRYPPLNIGATERRHLTINALKTWCASYAEHAVLLLCFEDVQWIDPTSKLLLTQLMEWVKTARVLLVITIRAAGSTAESLLQDTGIIIGSPEIVSYVTICEISELSHLETKELMVSVAEGDAMSQSEIDIVANKSEGIPLFVEELTKALLKARESHPDASPAAPVLVPDTISDALMAQLDRLGRAKDIAQYASVIGHEFSLDLLAQVTEKSTHELLPDLNSLIESRHVIASESSNVYLFKHALIRDSAYRSLLRKRRQAIHLKIARELAQRAAHATDDLIAQHYAMGEAHSEAVVFWQRAARNAIARSAHEEALRMLDAAIEHLPKLRGSASMALELDLVLAQAMALRSMRGYSAPEVEKRLLKARELCAKCEDSSSRFNVEWGLFQCTIVKGDIASARDIAGNLFDHAASHPDRPFVDAYLGTGMVAFHLGEFQSALEHFQNGVGLSRPEIDRPHFFTHGQNPGIFCLSYLARTETFLGYPDRAKSTVQRGLAIARARANDPGHIYTYVNALTFAVRVYQLCGDILFERQLANEIISIARRNHYAYYEALGLCHLGWAIGAESNWSDGIEKMVAGIAAVEQTGTSLALPGFYTYLSQLYIRAGRFDDATRVLESAVGPKHSATLAWDSEIERVRGEILASRSNPDLEQAESAYRRSMAVARNQGARWLGLRASSNLARLLQRMGRLDEAYAALKAGLEGISEGFDTDEVRTAQTALRQLIRRIAAPRTSSPR